MWISSIAWFTSSLAVCRNIRKWMLLVNNNSVVLTACANTQMTNKVFGWQRRLDFDAAALELLGRSDEMQLRPSTTRWERPAPAQLWSSSRDKYKYKKCIWICRQVYVLQRWFIFGWPSLISILSRSHFSCFTSIVLHYVVLSWSCLDLLSH